MKTILSAILIITATYANAQTIDSVTRKNPAPAIQDGMFKKILNKEFSYVVTGSSKSQVGNFASVNLTQPAATFNYSFVFDSGTILSLNGTADLKNGLSPVFTNTNLNTDVSFQPKVSFMGPVKRSLGVDESKLNKYNTEYTNLAKTLNENLILSKNTLELSLIRQKWLKDEIAKLAKQLDRQPTNDQLKYRLLTCQDSLNNMVQHIRNDYQIDITQYSTETPDFVKQVNDYQNQLKKSIARQQQALADQFNPSAFSINWFAISYKITNSAFSLFNPTLAYASQVSKTNFISHAITFEYDFYHYDGELPQRTWYLSVGADPSIIDNLPTLTTLNMQDVKNYTTTPQTRNSTKTYTAYLDTGKYKRNLKAIKLHADFYYFLTKGNQLAIHLNPMASYSQGVAPEYDEAVGILFCFKDAKDATGKAVVNTEIYANFLDVTNSLKQPGSFIGRNSIGLRFTFPINFVNP